MNKKRVHRQQMGMSVKAIIFYGERLLLLQKNDREGKHPWEFPGGGLEFGEDFERALRREVAEETGLTVQILGPVGLWSYRRSAWQYLTGMMMACISKSDQVTLSAEHCNYAWVHPAEIGDYALHESLRQALQNIDPEGIKRAADIAFRLRKKEGV